jgi:pSer/pThr/pTyr-binding forkhead associated (FHA) protein
MIASLVLVLRIVMVIALYGFLALALLTLWRDFQNKADFDSQMLFTGIDLTVAPEGDPPHTIHFSKSQITVGRGPLSDVELQDGTISARHSLLGFHHGQWWVEDLGSTNGTLLNQIPVTMPTVVTSDDVIQCGQTQITIALPVRRSVTPTVKLENQE